MSTFLKFAAVGFAGVVLLAILFVFHVLGIKREEINFRTMTEAQQTVVEISHDKMWKVIAQKVGISKQFTPEDQIAMISEVVEGRTGGTFAKAVTESNPTYDLSLLKDLSQSVEAEHAVVLREEKTLLEYATKHRNIVIDPYKSWYLGGAQPIVAKVISSTRSKEAIETGVDDNVDLFGDDKK
jgi:predicted transcriptional regulator